ncbi:hypothetical protein KR51_00015590 [Rubidibacter lacunae KORDI 51-2]|uniref:Uncharacterized protein n=1 Tax=Rubidibacter lacunae KORDI 51-2 TaxID=582515 RepID=U5DMA3_9CHRO|nr:hypothetical protein KR51_00015590 [Rubidibacter lacunae KORDI 51-2]
MVEGVVIEVEGLLHWHLLRVARQVVVDLGWLHIFLCQNRVASFF